MRRRSRSTGRNPSGHGSNAGWGTGGAMIHFFANWPRMHPVDFRVKSQYGKGLDWPISYDELSPWYDRAAADIGVSGDAAAERRWYPVGKDYPMPPLKNFRAGTIFNEAFAAHGFPLAPMPVAINSTDYKGRPACVNCGWCHVGCASGAHGTPLVSHLRDARKLGAEVRPFSYVTRVLTNPSGDRVTGVEYYDAKREQHVQPAGVVVLAAYAAETPRIMFNSATDKHPKGLANRNELVGKYLMCHTAANVWALFDEDIQNYMGTQANQMMSYEHYDNKTRPKKGFGSIFLRTGAAMKPNVGLASARPDLFGAPLDDFMKRAARGLTRIGLFGEQMPLAENRVELSSDKDEFGLPIARITHSYDQDAIGQLGVRARGSLRNRQGGQSEGSVERRRTGNGASDRRHHHGHGCVELGHQQLRADPRAGQSLHRRRRAVPDRRLGQSDQHDHGGDAARRRAHGEELQRDRKLIALAYVLSPAPLRPTPSWPNRP